METVSFSDDWENEGPTVHDLHLSTEAEPYRHVAVGGVFEGETVEIFVVFPMGVVR